MNTRQQNIYKNNSLYNPNAYPNQEHDACGVGFVAHINNEPERKIVEYALAAMSRLTHRGGQEEDKKMSDGSGILFPISKEFFAKEFPQILGEKKLWGLGSFFLPHDSFLQETLLESIKSIAHKYQFKIEAQREVPTDINILSRKVLATLPEFMQILFVSENTKINKENLEQHLYILRKQIEKESIKILQKHSVDLSAFHVASLSSKSVVYKGILPGKNLGTFYTDLADKDFKVTFAIFHERFSTNTKPSWHLTQPFRHIAHNGEINTIRGNKTHMSIREKALSSKILGTNLEAVLPCIHPSTSDSGAFDNVFELLLQGGYDINRAITTMIPEPTFANHENDEFINKKNAFYTYHEPLMEAWDGPTTMVYTDGASKIGASLDRNGLRPCRYSITKDNIIILSSEVGVLDSLDNAMNTRLEYVEHGQLAPRTLLLVDFDKKKVLQDVEIKENLFNTADYTKILKEKRFEIKDEKSYEYESKLENLHFVDLFGYNEKSPEAMLSSMVKTKEEPVGAMGLDEPLAVLSKKPQSLFNYFKQLFAQVTNPSIDPIREKFSMSLRSILGGKANLFEEAEEQANYFELNSPFLFASTLEQIEANKDLDTHIINIIMPLHSGYEGFRQTLDDICAQAKKAVKNGAKIIVISDKSLTKVTMPLPVLLALGAVHQELIHNNLRHLCDIVVETGEAYEVMNMALLLSFGANAIYPYAAYAAIGNYVEKKKIKEVTDISTALSNYHQALEKGLLKVFARLGVSTLSSFIGSQSFECIGFNEDVINKYFTNTLSRIGGISLEDIHTENYERFLSFIINTHETSKNNKHIWSKEVCSILRKSVIDNDYNFFKAYSKQLWVQEEEITLRSTWKFKETNALDLSEVESVENIRERFYSAPMSLGALSKESHECIAEAFNNLGLNSNCGEGGEEIERSLSRGSEKDLCSRIRQIASGRFGVTAEYLAAGDEVQIKIAQGAKPGEGGQLPAHKVTSYIAKVRHTKENVSLISPPPHHDIYSIEDLAQLIFDIKKLRKGLRVSVKLVAQAGIGTVAVGVVKAGADSIIISGHDGGTGAAPLSSIYHVGLPWEIGLAEVHQALLSNAMRHKVSLQTDGQIQSGRDIVTAFMLGADSVAFGTSLLVSMGCILCRQCYKGACPVGICSQDEKMREKFKGKAEHIENYLTFLAKETQSYMADLGIKTVDELIGQAHLFETNVNLLPKKAQNLDMTALFQNLPYKRREKNICRPIEIEDWEDKIFQEAIKAVEKQKALVAKQWLKNTDRATGVEIAGLLALSYKDFEDDFITLDCEGTAGQSLGAFAPKGLSIHLKGSANDYVGKGLCGGIISIEAEKGNDFENQSLIGNVALYGATSGKLFVNGKVGERFAVRNSGALAVVEGVGEHGCEYMTGGTVVILGGCGNNFAAGMTGGLVYIYEEKEKMARKINPVNIAVKDLESEDITQLKSLIEEHFNACKSNKAKTILENFEKESKNFSKVVYSN